VAGRNHGYRGTKHSIDQADEAGHERGVRRIRIVPNTKLERMARAQGLIAADNDLLVPVFANPDQVIHEFMP